MTLNFRKSLVAIVLFLFTSASQATEPWERWARNPLAIPLTVYTTNILAATNSTITVTLGDGMVEQRALSCTSTKTNAPAFVANLQVRREYTLTVVGSNVTSFDLKFEYQPNWTPIYQKGKRAKPKDYQLVVDGALHSGTINESNPGGSCTTYSNTWTIELTENLPGNWRLEDGSDDPEPAPGDGTWMELGPGKSTNKWNTAYSWSVSLGRMMDGLAAGRLGIRDNRISTNTFKATNIFYLSPAEVTRAEIELITIDTNSLTLRQVKAYQTFVDITEMTNATEMSFYLTNQIGVQTNQFGHFTNITGSPFVVWSIFNPASPGTNQVQVIERRNGLNRTNYLIYDSSSSTATWTLKYGTGTVERVETRGVVFNGSPTTNRVETVDIRYSGASVPTYRATEKYHNFPWGFDLIETRIDPDNSVLTSNDLVTEVSYYTNSAEPWNYQKPKTMKYPDGYWENRSYASDFSAQTFLTPRLSDISDPNSATDSNSILSVYSGTDDGSYGYIDRSEYDAVSSLQVPFKEEVKSRYWQSGVNKTFDGFYSRASTKLFVGEYQEGNDEYWYYGEARQKTFRGHAKSPFSQSYFHGGTYDSGAKTFAVNGSVVADGPDWRKTTFYTGQRSDGRDEEYLYNLASIDGETISYWDVPYGHESWMEREVFKAGSLVMKETFVITGMDGSFDLQYESLYKMLYSNDSLGHVTNIVKLDSSGSVSRTVYEADYKGSQTFDGELKLWEKDERGIKTTFTYDPLKRISTLVKEGVAASGGFPSQADITTTATYDASHQPLVQVVGASSLFYTNSATYDFAGRKTSETDTNGLTTAISYDLGGRKSTILLPSGLTEIRENYLDRRLKSVTGTAVVNEFHTWTNMPYAGWGDMLHQLGTFHGERILHQVELGSAGSGRILKYGIDWVGETNHFEKPDWSLTNVVVQSSVRYISGDYPIYKYDTLHGNTYMAERSGYDIVGRESLTAQPVAGTSDISESSSARLKRSDIRFLKAGSDWFQMTTNLVYRTFGSATPTIVSVIKERINGFSSGNTLSETTTTDVDGNVSIVTSTVDRTNKKVTDVSNPANSTLNATNITINGLLRHVSTPTVSAPLRYAYDALGRQVAITNSLGFPSSTTFDDRSRVSATTDATGMMTTFAYYDNTEIGAGRPKTVSVGGKTTRYEYVNYGVSKIWGDVPYPEQRIYDQFGDMTELRTYSDGSGWSNVGWPSGNTNYSKTIWQYQPQTGLLAGKVDNAGKSNYFTYYQELPITHTWARGTSVTNHYNELGEMLAKDYSDGTPSFAYTNASITSFSRSGRPQFVSDASGIWRFEYDQADRMTASVCTNGSFNGITVSNRINSVYGKDRVYVSGASSPVDTSYGFDSSGRISSVTNGSASATYVYLSNSDLVSSTTFKNSTTTRLITTKLWDFGARLRSINNVAGSETISSRAYVYDGLNRRRTATLEDNSFWNYDYNDRDEVISGSRYWPDLAPVSGQQFSYSFDNIGNRTTALFGGDVNGQNLRTITYSPNSLNEYASVSTAGYKEISGASWATNAVLVNGNVTDRKAEYFHSEVSLSNSSGPLWQTATVVAGGTTNSGGFAFPKSSQTYSYDDDGNLTFDGVWAYQWDGENRLAQMTMTNIASVSTNNRLKLVFAYDCQNRRTVKKVFPLLTNNVFSTNATADLRFIHDGWNLQAQIGATNGIIQTYAWGKDLGGTLDKAGGIGGLVNINDGSANYFPSFDGNGNVTALIKGDGTPSARYEFGAFGEQIRVDGSFAKLNPFRFSTKFCDEETGLSYYGSRYFNSSSGRWINRDPAEESSNPYLFCKNRPLQLIDPDGRWTIAISPQLTGGIWGVGGTVGLSLSFGYSSDHGLTMGAHYNYGSGIMAGPGSISLAMVGSITTATSCRNLTGGGLEYGASGGFLKDVGVGFTQSLVDTALKDSYVGGEISLGIGLGAEAHMFFMHQGGVTFLDFGNENDEVVWDP